ncbi:HIT domain-containing protein [bacterium]|jgi:ATP adenylyltransferase|nr:HIT domain-containing protein [bacterium]
MKSLHCPWREKYIKRTQNKNIKNDCIFCEKIKENKDEKNYIIFRAKHSVVILNLFPYNAGHLLIMPNKHKKDLASISKNTRSEIMELTSKATTVLEKTLKCDGINIGINLGEVAGAGIPGHVHIHILPRWNGDTNFMPTLSNTKQISCDMNRIYKELRKEFCK